MGMEQLSSAMVALSPRARRAVALIALATVAIAATSTYYLRPWEMLRATSTKATIALSSPRSQREWIEYAFLNSALGWAVIHSPTPSGDPGTYAVFKTADGAKHWEKRFEGRESQFGGPNLQFVDRSTGFVAVGDPLELRRTTDSGEHWTKLSVPTQDVAGFHFLDPRNGWLFTGSRGPHLFASHDGGVSWVEVNGLPADIGYLPQFRNLLEGWVGSSGGGPPHVYMTGDGGASWERHDLPAAPETGQAEQYSTWVALIPEAGLMVSVYPESSDASRPYSYTSLDGRSWTLFGGPSEPRDLSCCAFQDATHWWVVIGPDLYKTADRGDTWFHVDARLPENLYLMRVLDAKHAWGQSFSQQGYSDLFFTADGGVHWTMAKTPSRQ